ncbi:putative disease resistance protein RGA1 [Ricinus communis]|uniref:Leucine-rich repeat containing protein, putative n=1 Tax=Ricinus communis TaxID=3988 RepID=B9S054_RICCO|nr:putative disease resistance protein RGA1 [Ricinus communis]EEF42990.1 leucine-rich repeat containing protein, putative [Ricinus communis]|eukprot:XP_002519373.1 putative disease resistance protein RGA1 [Ricinus communis]
MAEAVPFGIATNILMNLGSSTFQEIGATYGVKKDLRKLENTLSTIKAALLDAEERQEKSHLVQDWIRKLKDVVYDADDVLDSFATKALSRQLDTTTAAAAAGIRIKEQVSEFFSMSNQLAFRYKMAQNIKDIRERVDDIAADMWKFNFKGRVFELGVHDKGRGQTHSFVPTSEIIGRDRNKEEIVNLLTCSSSRSNLSIVPIVGIGGSGKTTLAQLVYQDKRVVSSFEERMWVCVYKNFDVRMIASSIVKSITKIDPGNLELDQLQSCLRENLDGKRYLLVLDDVWDESYERWVCLESLLRIGAQGSKILVTTRSRKVASVMGISCPYVLEGLREDDCWALFEHMAFEGDKERVNPSLITIGKQMVRRCKGVPLAVKSLGNVMRTKTEETEWLTVQNDEIWRISFDDDEIMPALKLSYDHLPIPLRQCFAFCSIFPKEYIIQKDLLIQLWIAHGYIHSTNGNQHLEDLGDQYFKDLLARSFFQEVETDEYGHIKTFKMHDLMHGLAQVVAGTDCAIAGTDVENISERVHHVSVLQPSYSPEVAKHLLEAKSMRTLFLPDDYGFTEESAWATLISKFKCLRALDLHHSCIRQLPYTIGKLKHLRYLDLSDNGDFKSLPCFICNLYNLQTLLLSNCTSLQCLPRDLGKLISLRHLMIDGCHRLTHLPSQLGKLTSLQRLPRFIIALNKECFPGSAKLKDLNGLNQLRDELCIENLGEVKNDVFESKGSNLKGKKFLRSLNLNWGPIRGGDNEHDELLMQNLQPHSNLKKLHVEGYGAVKFSSWLSLLRGIVKITIKNCHKCQHLPPLHELRTLKFLSLQELTNLEYIDDGSSQPSSSLIFFPSLKVLSLVDLPNLKRWWRTKAAAELMSNSEIASSLLAEHQEEQPMLLPFFPRLSSLKVHHCFNLTSMPLHPYLEELYLYEVSEELLQQQRTMIITAMTMRISMMMMMMAALQSPKASSSSPSSSSSTSCSTSSSFNSSIPSHYSFSASPLSKLKSLQLVRIDDLKSLPEIWLPNLTSLELIKIEECPRLQCLPGEGFRALTSLRTLRIYRCENLKTLSQGIQYLTALEELRIKSCEKLHLSDDGMQLQDLKNLHCLELNDIPRMTSLPNWIQDIPCLLELHIEECHSLSTLPEWIGSLSSLQRLKISYISRLTSLPDSIRALAALQQLRICNCPKLSKRCRKPTGADWLKFSHVAMIKINGKWVQRLT